MKKLILNILMILPMLSMAQEHHIYFSAGADVRNAIAGSKATNDNPQLDAMFKVGLVSDEGVEVVIGFETFEAIDFNRMYFGVGKQFIIAKDLILVLTIEPTLINRKDDWGGGLSTHDNKSSHLTLGFSCPLRYSITDELAVEWQPNLLWRTDINAKYGNENWDGLSIAKTPAVFSNFISIVYKL